MGVGPPYKVRSLQGINTAYHSNFVYNILQPSIVYPIESLEHSFILKSLLTIKYTMIPLTNNKIYLNKID